MFWFQFLICFSYLIGRNLGIASNSIIILPNNKSAVTKILAFCKHNKDYCDSLFGGVTREKIMANRRLLLDQKWSHERNEAIKRSLLDDYWSRDKNVQNKRFILVEKFHDDKSRHGRRRIGRKNIFLDR